MTISSRRFFTHSLILTVSVFFAFAWTKSETLTDYNLQLIAFLVIIYSGSRFFIRKTVIDMIALSLAVFLLVFATGALSSPIFFLLYFLLFGLSLLFEPASSLFLVTLLTVLFLIIPTGKDLLHELLQLASLFMIVPLAVIFGKQYIKLRRNALEVKALESEEKVLTKKVERQKSKVKFWTNAVFGQKLAEIQNYIKSLEQDPAATEEKRIFLRGISTKIYEIFLSGKEMEKEIKNE